MPLLDDSDERIRDENTPDADLKTAYARFVLRGRFPSRLPNHAPRS